MTAATGIPSSSPARPAGAPARLLDSGAEDGARLDLSELAAFSELFAEIESGERDEIAAEPEPAAQPQIPDETAETADALTLEMTYYQWFGATDPSAQETPLRRSAPLLIVRAEDAAPAGAAEETPAPMPPFALSGLSDPSQVEVNAAAALQPARLSEPGAPTNAPAQPKPAIVIKPEDIAETLARVQSATAREVAPAKAPAAPVSPKADAGEVLPATVKESLSALENVLSIGGKETRDRATADGRQPGAAMIKDVRVSAVRQETHFMPAFAPSPVLQISERIQREVQPGAFHFTPMPPDPARMDAGPLRVLKLQLDPPQLGPLTIRMSLRDQTLSLQLEAKQDTAAAIHRDRDILVGLLRAAGYAVEGVQVQASGGDRGASPQGQSLGNPGAFGQPAGQQQGWRQSGARTASRNWSDVRTQEIASPSHTHEPSSPHLRKPRSGPVYL